jgi:hypothetical protein
MKMIPVFRCLNIKEAISFYTPILDFELKEPGTSSGDRVVVLANEDAELILTSLEGDQKTGIAVCVLVEDEDSLFEKYIKRGLDISDTKGSLFIRA